jgi:PAS domain S-box-containing protein
MPQSPRVLYVEEEPERMDRVETLPGPDGGVPVTTLTERTAAAGFERLGTDAVDSVVSEQELPDSTGIEFLRDVRARYPTLPFVLFTEVELATIAEAAVEAGLTGYVRRYPNTDQREELAQKVADALTRYPGSSLVEETKRFRTIIEQSSDVVSILDRTGEFVYQSPSIESVLGYDPGETVGGTLFGYVHPDDSERVRTEFFAAVENPDRTLIAEYQFKHADGSWRVVESRGTNMLNDPIVEGVVVNTRDITGRRRREQRMNVLNRTLRHDLRNAMNVVRGNAELLLREYGGDDRAETIRSRAASMLDLSDKVRDIERALDTGDEPRQMVDLVSVLEEHLSAVRRSRPDVTVEADLPESKWVLANSQLGVAIENAIENAIEHNDADDPVVRVTVESAEIVSEDAVTVIIADNGPGIPEEELDVLTQGDETPLEHTSGLGLWLIKWIITESAGEVTVEQSEAAGTAVRMTLETARVGEGIDV